MIEYKNVDFTYSRNTPFSQKVLENFNLKIESGENIAIMGKTGCGKSTVVKLCNGLIKPDNGTIEVDGLKTTEKKTLMELRKKVGLVFQYPENQFFCPTVSEEIGFALKNFGFADRVEEMTEKSIRTVGLSHDFLGRSPFRLSGGEMRLVAIASVICWEPDYIFLDEPTAGLDFRGRKKISELIRNLNEYGKTTVTVTHNQDFVKSNMKRIVHIKNGLKFFDGPVEEYSFDEDI